MPLWLSNLRESSLVVRTGVLAAALAGVFLLTLPVAWCCGGPAGVAWAGKAGLACLAGSALALVTSEPFRSARRALAGMLVGMVFRMGVPAVIALLAMSIEAAARAGFLYYLVLYFEVALAVEVLLWLPPAGQREPKRQ
jgi:hypothetical protein